MCLLIYVQVRKRLEKVGSQRLLLDNCYLTLGSDLLYLHHIYSMDGGENKERFFSYVNRKWIFTH